MPSSWRQALGWQVAIQGFGGDEQGTVAVFFKHSPFLLLCLKKCPKRVHGVSFLKLNKPNLSKQDFTALRA